MNHNNFDVYNDVIKNMKEFLDLFIEDDMEDSYDNYTSYIEELEQDEKDIENMIHFPLFMYTSPKEVLS